MPPNQGYQKQSTEGQARSRRIEFKIGVSCRMQLNWTIDVCHPPSEEIAEHDVWSGSTNSMSRLFIFAVLVVGLRWFRNCLDLREFLSTVSPHWVLKLIHASGWSDLFVSYSLPDWKRILCLIHSQRSQHTSTIHELWLWKLAPRQAIATPSSQDRHANIEVAPVPPPIALLKTIKSQLIGLLAGPYWTPEVEKSNQNNPTNAISGAPKASFFEHQKLTFSIPGLELKSG